MRRPRRYHIKRAVMANMLESNKTFNMASVEAIQMTGLGPSDIDIYRWLETFMESFPSHTKLAPKEGISVDPETGYLLLATSKGVVEVEPGDWVIRDSHGKFLKCEQDVFEATYDLA